MIYYVVFLLFRGSNPATPAKQNTQKGVFLFGRGSSLIWFFVRPSMMGKHDGQGLGSEADEYPAHKNKK
ncbi:MAG: hypothetical protein IKB98_03495 [Clostridia bacterium]|nr:hypothetical protein [Clostridia bacterium]